MLQCPGWRDTQQGTGPEEEQPAAAHLIQVQARRARWLIKGTAPGIRNEVFSTVLMQAVGSSWWPSGQRFSSCHCYSRGMQSPFQHYRYIYFVPHSNKCFTSYFLCEKIIVFVFLHILFKVSVNTHKRMCAERKRGRKNITCDFDSVKVCLLLWLWIHHRIKY